MASILQTTATREEWLQTLYNKSGSDNSVKAGKGAIKKWDLYLESLGVKEHEILSELKTAGNSTEVYLFFNKYIQWLAQSKISPISIKIFFSVLKSWLRANGIRIYSDDVKQFIQFPKAQREIRQPLTMEIIRGLVENAPRRLKAILLVLVSSGMRISEVLQLRPEDIDTTKNPIEINIRAHTTKTKEQRMAFISNEAFQSLKPYLDKCPPGRTIFSKQFNEYTLINTEIAFNKLRAKCGYLKKYSNDTNYHVNIHSFRAYYHTQATRILGGDIAHALLGHHKYLDQYFRLSEDERTENYKKLELALTVSNEDRQKVVIENQTKQIRDYEYMKIELEKQKAKIKRLESLR